MPSGLEIDYKKQLSGTMPPYTQHVVIRTGQNDWNSRIHTGMSKQAYLARGLKRLTGLDGKFHDVSNVFWI